MSIYYGTMTYYGGSYELYHHGVLGQKWGTRRYQNEDGSLTPEGREHYGYGSGRAGIIKTAKNYVGRRIDSYANAVNDVSQNGLKGAKRQYLNYTTGHQRYADAYNTLADNAQRRAERSAASNSQWSKEVNERSAQNMRNFAKHEQETANSSSIAKRIVNDFGAFSIKEVNINTGKETTTGKEIVKGILTLGIGGNYGTIASVKVIGAHVADFAHEG